MLRKILSVVLTSHGLDLLAKGSIFLVNPDGRSLNMEVGQGLQPGLLATCKRVEFGHCMCGRAAETRTMVFSDRIDENHDITYEGMEPHGHYCTPIIHEDELLGVLNLYVPHGHVRNAIDESFISTVTGTLAEVIRRRRAEDSLREREEHLRNLVENAGDAIFVHDFDGRILSANRAACKMLGYEKDDFENLYIADIDADFDVGAYTERWMSMSPDKPLVMEGQYKRKAGRSFPVEITMGYYLTGEKPLIVSMAHDITERRKALEKIRHLASHDILTNLPNRSLFMDRLRVALANARRHDNGVALLFVDLDGFKPINDTLGHDAGDELLRQVATRLNECVRESDTVGRYGGDEFTVLLGDLDDRKDAEVVAEKILQSLSEPFSVEYHTVGIGCSIGVAVFPEHGGSPESLIKQSDAAMYEAKHAGRGGYRMASPEASL